MASRRVFLNNLKENINARKTLTESKENRNVPFVDKILHESRSQNIMIEELGSHVDKQPNYFCGESAYSEQSAITTFQPEPCSINKSIEVCFQNDLNAAVVSDSTTVLEKNEHEGRPQIVKPNIISNVSDVGSSHNIKSSDSSSTDSDSDSTNSSNDYDSDDSVADPDFNPTTEKAPNNWDSQPTAEEQSQTTQTISPPKKAHKRKANPNTWKTNVLKRLRHSGKNYATKTKVVNAKSVKPTCGDKCRQKCTTKFTEEQRTQIFDAYYALPDALHKRTFIAYSIEEIKPKYVYKSSNRPRKNNLKFFFKDCNNQKVRVCQKFFLNTLDVSLSIIRTVRNKVFDMNNPMPLLEDRRGKHEHHPSVGKSLKNIAIKFIESIPRVESHYVRANSSREYISGGRNLSDIYRDYVKMCTDKKEKYINYVMFHKIFNTEFNISFFIPKKDACEDCTAYSNAVGCEKEVMRKVYEDHINEKELSRLEKEKDKNEAQ
ncbi:uncharacterized protein LOC126884617 [Diabrotica virgifera virgifera]|uniref:Uncharacterized protein n=1 Tax=Diabrotica virgifera virgifera TaxID=50390 RepID=A0ABM5K8X6_DIAVI|nr:uncharacterized protein LOC126884617 [Diabrotica virgifera virgifera]